MGKDQVYQIADAIFANKHELEAGLIESISTLLPSEETLVLVDLTNTYFEGNTLAKRGHSKEKRQDAPLVSLALVVDERGLPVY